MRALRHRSCAMHSIRSCSCRSPVPCTSTWVARASSRRRLRTRGVCSTSSVKAVWSSCSCEKTFFHKLPLGLQETGSRCVVWGNAGEQPPMWKKKLFWVLFFCRRSSVTKEPYGAAHEGGADGMSRLDSRQICRLASLDAGRGTAPKKGIQVAGLAGVPPSLELWPHEPGGSTP